ncbi:hypothetical protein K450DRAFT_236887 [Umbelopsis ramanniana AG]|uniref:Uncharacterized protein n=1 Tax=Umbelopsis ramanniana AG TaxID=1314678 RepID=A0AAD5EDS6_UMBRA|nr:uncharacterized protein K450DRAFT_236887 [Umbelopsis ramanniana AG]KAI8580405.1 hypothetical protein K450DRAFT_236887 [Umbelopsis ramanniana AG]
MSMKRVLCSAFGALCTIQGGRETKIENRNQSTKKKMLGSLKGLTMRIQIIDEIVQECNTEMLMWVYKSVHFAFADVLFFWDWEEILLCCLALAGLKPAITQT